MSKVLVSGGVGFIGSHLVDKLIELGHEVVVVDDLSTGKKENLNPKATFIKYDISKTFEIAATNEFNNIGKYCQNIDYIFHLAAIPGVPYSVAHPTETHRVNVLGTFEVFKFASKIKAKKVIFASSCAIYGDQEIPFKETMFPQPISPYACQKAIGELYAGMFYRVYDLPIISLRFFNVYGSRSDPNSEYSLVISKFKKLKEEGKPLTIYGDGSQTRDFIYVDDVVDACIKAMESDIKNEIINICSGQSISVNKIADLIGGEKKYLPIRKGDMTHISGDNTKAKELLKWEAKTPIEKGIKLF